MEYIDFSKCKRTHLPYGGTDKKFGVEFNNSIYMLKFSEDHAKKSDISTSSVNNVVSEYVSSHISQSVGLPTHETILGFYGGEVVVGCKDFRMPQNYQNIEFSEYMRAVYSSKQLNKFVNIDMVYDALADKQNGIPEALQKEMIERYWDTFVVDALVGNFDRHTGNWGFLAKGDEIKLAPVYDYGSTLYPRLSDDGMVKMKSDRFELFKHCLVFPSPNMVVTKEKVGKVGYYDMLASNYDENCTDALLRIVPKINLNDINKIIDETPLITETRKQFYKQIIGLRKQLIIDRAYICCLNKNYDKEAYNRIVSGKQFEVKDLNEFIKQYATAETEFKKSTEQLTKYFSPEQLRKNILQGDDVIDKKNALLQQQMNFAEKFGFRNVFISEHINSLEKSFSKNKTPGQTF